MRGLSSESLIARVGFYVNKWIDYRTKISEILIDFLHFVLLVQPAVYHLRL